MRRLIRALELGAHSARRAGQRLLLSWQLGNARREQRAIEIYRDRLRKLLVAAVTEIRRLQSEIAISETAAIEARERTAAIAARIDALSAPSGRPTTAA